MFGHHDWPGEPPGNVILPVSKSNGISGDGERRSTRRGEAVAGSTDLAPVLERKHEKTTTKSPTSVSCHRGPSLAAPRDLRLVLLLTLASYVTRYGMSVATVIKRVAALLAYRSILFARYWPTVTTSTFGPRHRDHNITR